MSAWDDYNGSTSSPVAGSSGSRQFKDVGGSLPSSSAGGIYRPTPAAGPPPAPTEGKPGVVSVNPLNPGETSLDPISQLFDGLRQGLVGGNEDTDAGKATRENSPIGRIPLIGDAGRAIASGLGGVGEVLGVGVNAVGGTLERVNINSAGEDELDAEFNGIDPEFRKQYDEAIAKERGLFGTGLLDNDWHWKSEAVKAWRKDQSFENPTLNPGLFRPPGSIAGVLGALVGDTFEVGSAVVAKHWAQLDTPGQEGMDRIDLITAVGDEDVAFNEDTGILGTGILAGDPTTGLNDMEALVYAKMKAGDWTRDEAADFLASNGQAFGHSVIANIGGSVALDPLNLATGGAGAIAKFGARGALMASRLASAEAKLAEVGKAYESAQVAMKAARVGGKGAENLSAAKKATAVALENLDTAKASVKSISAYRSGSMGGAVKRINVLARGAEGSQKLGTAFRAAGKVYAGLEGTNIGRVAKATRTIIDPLHALDLSMPGSSKLVDLYSDALPATVVDTLGVHHYKGMLDDALRSDPTRGMYDQLGSDIAVASANMGRGGLVDIFRSNQIAGNLSEELMGTLPEDIFETAVKTTKQADLQKWLRFSTLKNVLVESEDWTTTAHQTLANGLEQAYHTRSADQWLESFKTMSKEQKSLYKLAVYGNANRELLNFTANVSADVAAKLPVPVGRMVLLAKGTLSRVGGESLLTKLTKTKGTAKRARLIAEWQEKYPSLRYISLDPTALDSSVDQFIVRLEEGLDKLPMQLTGDELKALGPEGDKLKSVVGEYSLGFRPEDKFLWGLERDSATGLYRPASAAWADHVADGSIGYRPARALRANIAGHPLVDMPVIRAGARVVDHMDSAVRTMKTQVSSAMVTETARKRFNSVAVGELGEHGVTDRVAQSWFERINEYTRAHQGYSGPRGMGGDELYRAIKDADLIPQTLLSGDRKLHPDDIMRLVLRAYDGDMRYIGLTQKFSGRAKRYLFEATGSNFAGQIAEHAWPTLKFRYNPIFQLQEKVEPWVLNAQRGVSFAPGIDMSEADRLTSRLLQNMTDNSIVRQADIDNFEQSAAVLFGQSMHREASKSGSRLNAIQRAGRQLGEVQGMKRVNMLRTFRKGLGREIKQSWETANPGAWDNMKEAADLRAGRILDDDDFALQLISENAFANDIFVNRVLNKAGKFDVSADFANAVKTGAWHAPTTLGELKALDLDHMASSLHLTANGKDITDLNGLRQALATNRDETMNKVVDALTRLGADQDYIRRTRNALDFSWTGFWKTATDRFSMTGDESAALQTMMAQAAKLRDMTPVEFMSQVFSPNLLDGTEGILGHLEGQVRILRDARAAGRNIKPRIAKVMDGRTRIAGKEGVSTREDFVRQLSRGFSAHLDPSAKRALLMEFRPELRRAISRGEVKFDLDELNVMWDDLAEGELADRILGYMDGKAPIHASDELDDLRGSAFARDASAQYMRDMGVEPLGGRPHFQLDADMDGHYEAGAAHFRDLPDVEYEKTGRIPNAGGLKKAGIDLKPKPDSVDDATYRSYQSMVQDSQNQFDYLTRPKGKGGMGVKVVVSKKDPYTADAAGRAAMVKDLESGTLKVFGGASDHSLMTNEQNVIFRAVHDVFGHAAEGFEFGPRGELNAAAKHARMFSNEGRPAMLTETHGQTAYVNYSDDLYQPADSFVPRDLDPANPADDFEARFPFERPERQAAMADPDEPVEATINLRGDDPYGIPSSIDHIYSQRVGQGLRSRPVEEQTALLQPLADLLDEFPGMKVHHIDVVDFGEPLGINPSRSMADDDLLGIGQRGGLEEAFAQTWGAEADESVILFNSRWLDRMGTDWSGVEANNQLTANYDTFTKTDPKTGKPRSVKRETTFGTKHNAGKLDIASVQRHESFHAFDVSRRPHESAGASSAGLTQWRQKPRSAADQPYHDMMTRFEADAGRLDLSEYGMTNSAEFAAELGAFATTPGLVLDDIASEPLRAMVEEFQQFLKDSGEWVPKAAAEANPLAGKTIREVNAIKRGTAYAPQKAGLLPQEYIDEFSERFVGRSKHVESNPDVSRTAQMFGKWTDAVVTNGLLRGENSVHAGILHDIAGLPTGGAVPYNFTEAATVNLAMQSMTRKWADAFRLQYFSQERSMFERTLNHPMFGMYPASYMWGKIMPELVRFIAAEPFGQKTGGLLYSLMDVQSSIAMRREYDPEFDAKIEEMGHSQAMSFGGYLLPTLPWDVSASAPGWMRSIGQQGASNASDPASAEPVSLLDPAVDTFKKLAPLTTTLPWAGRAIDELNGAGSEKEATKDEADHDKLVRASELQPTMQRVMQELQEALQ